MELLIKSTFLAVHSIVCPSCKMKQTGIVRISAGTVNTLPYTYKEESLVYSHKFKAGHPYILCCYIPCQHLITGDELEEVTRLTVKSPSDFRS